MKALIFIYNAFLIFILLLAFLPLAFWMLIKKHSIKRRLGIVNIPDFHKKTIWFHAASMGEVNAGYFLVKKMHAYYPDYPIVFTTTTQTGLKKVKAIMPFVDNCFILPIDIYPIIRRFIIRIDPQVVFIIETELWPNLIRILKKKKIPIYLINARLSDKSFPVYQKLKFFWSALLKYFTLIIAKSTKEAQRFNFLTDNKVKISVVRNIKSISLLALVKDSVVIDVKIKNWKNNDLIFTLGSIREKEEDKIFNILKIVQDKYTQLKIVLVPRHLSRLNELKQKFRQQSIAYSIYSQFDFSDDKRTLLVDEMGKLLSIYMLSDISFVGGTLENYGGHNVLEPVLFKKPVIFGPYTANCQQEANLIIKYKAGYQINDEYSLLKKLDLVLKNKAVLKKLTANTNKIIQSLQDNCSLICNHLPGLKKSS